jgi:hypothetical protein
MHLKLKGRVFTFEEVKNELAKYAIDLGVEGIDPEYGYGMVNIGKIGAAIMTSWLMLDQPMTIQNNRTLAPLRFVIETNGGQVLGWDNNTKTVTFKTPAGKKVTMQVR